MADAEFRAFQKTFFQALRDRPLDLSDPADARLYEPLHDPARDPVVRLHDTIEFSVGESVQLVAGFRGTGKTTEFSRLETRLWDGGYAVIRVDLDEYLDVHSPIDVVDFLIVLTGAISDTLVDERLLGPKALKPSWWERIRGVVGLEVEGVSVKAGPVSMKVGMKSDPGFRERMRSQLAGRLPVLVQEVRAHHAEVLDALGDVELVVIVDSLEHVRGTFTDDALVRNSIQNLFYGHARELQLPDTHMVLSVPAFLALQADNLAAQFVNGAVQAWSSCQVISRDGTPYEPGVERLVRLVERRGDWRRILGDRAALERIVLASGGYLRDLLNMLIEGIHLAGHPTQEPIEQRILAVARRSYEPLYSDEIAVLKKIAERRSVSGLTREERPYLLRFLDSHLVLCYLDDAFWYDVHPLVRDRVLKG